MFIHTENKKLGRDSSGGIATRYRLDAQGSNPGGGQEIPYLSIPALGLTQPPTK
jgi:hypothetical protein